MSDAWVKKLKELAEAIEHSEKAHSEEAQEGLLKVWIPTPENSPVANLMGLPEWEVAEWMIRRQDGRMH